MLPHSYGYRKLEAYATWGMLPACLPSHWQLAAENTLTNIFISPAQRSVVLEFVSDQLSR